MMEVDLGTWLQQLRSAFPESPQHLVGARRGRGAPTARAEYPALEMLGPQTDLSRVLADDLVATRTGSAVGGRLAGGATVS